MTNDTIRLALVDDHQIVLDGLCSLLNDAPRIGFAFTTTDPRSVIAQLRETPVDVLLTDITMPHLSGNILAKTVHKEFPKVKILALSMSGDESIVKEMINDSDISGYILKNIGKQELIHAIEKIAGGGIYFSPEILEALSRDEQQKKDEKNAHLTAREIEIIRLIEKEYSNRDIAKRLFISERTVETHRKNIFRKTGINSLIGLVKYAYEHKLLN